ncbi:MAG: hypothetical protein M1828_000968 [Chrysothrix sp. TS-e1954]|nr:MAG: hypothetical protein M1828_000968 [Chrysothrix sp. TS-e1954]
MTNLLSILLYEKDIVKVKPTFIALTLFLSKNFVSTGDLMQTVSAFSMVQDLSVKSTYTFLSSRAEVFITRIMQYLNVASTAPSAGQFLAIFSKQMTDSSDNEGGDVVPCWYQPFLYFVIDESAEIESLLLNFLPDMLKISVTDFGRYIETLQADSHLCDVKGPNDCIQLRLLLASLNIGKQLGLAVETDGSSGMNLTFHENIVHLPLGFFDWTLEDASPSVRISGLSLAISSSSSTKPFTDRHFQAFRTHLPYMLGDPDSYARGELYSSLKTLLHRVQAASLSLARQLQTNRRALSSSQDLDDVIHFGDLSNALNAHRDFVVWLHVLASTHMHPCASYQNRLSALVILRMQYKSGLDPRARDEHVTSPARQDLSWPFDLTLVTDLQIRLLCDLLMDPFDDIRGLAMSILSFSSHPDRVRQKQTFLEASKSQNKSSVDLDLEFAAQHCPGDTVTVEILTLRRAESRMLRSGRVACADGFARARSFLIRSMLQVPANANSVDYASLVGREHLELHSPLFDSLEACLVVAERDLLAATYDKSLYGYFTALRYAVTDRQIYRETYDELHSIFINRAIHLIRRVWYCMQHVLCNDAPEGYLPGDGQEDEDHNSKDVSTYAWRSVKESSLLGRDLAQFFPSDQVLTTESSKEPLLKALGDLSFSQLAHLRHRGAFSTVAQLFATILGTSGTTTTRRSAGIPPIIIALLSADKKAFLLPRFMSDMRTIATQSMPSSNATALDLPQVHALNALRAAFTTAALANATQPYVVDVLSVAAASLSSVFLVERMMRSNDNLNDNVHGSKADVRMPLDAYPGLLDLILRLLRMESSHPAAKESGRESAYVTELVFPVLDLLRKLTVPASHLVEIRSYVLMVLGNKHWHVRDMAAHVMASALASGSLTNQVEVLLSNVPHCTTNEMHGRYLSLRYTFASLHHTHQWTSNEADFDQAANLVCMEFSRMKPYAVHPILRATAIEVANMIGHMLVKYVRPEMSRSSIVNSFHKMSEAACQMCRLEHQRFKGLLLLQHEAYKTNELLGILIELLDTSHVIAASLSQRMLESSRCGDGLVFSRALEAVIDSFKHLPTEAIHCCTEGFCLILSSTSDPIVVAAVAQALIEMLLQEHVLNASASSSRADKALANLDYDMDSLGNGSPSVRNRGIFIWAASLAAKHRHIGGWTDQLQTQVQAWIANVRQLLDHEEDFPIRLAGASSLTAMTGICQVDSPAPESIKMQLLFAVYATLIDDDEEIRDLGSKIVTKWIGADVEGHRLRGDIVPPRAAYLLLEHLGGSFGHSTILLEEALKHILGSPSDGLEPFATWFEPLLNQRDVLFARERPNLFVDDVHEAKVWSRLLKNIPANIVPVKTMQALVTWTIDGLLYLEDKTRCLIDGPLGWTSKVETFALGMRLLCASDVLLYWSTEAAETSVHLREKLLSIASLGKDSLLHELWLQKIAEIVQ